MGVGNSFLTLKQSRSGTEARNVSPAADVCQSVSPVISRVNSPLPAHNGRLAAVRLPVTVSVTD